MVRISIKNISQILLNALPCERRFDSGGDLAIDPIVAGQYAKEGYDSLPKSKREADARGIKNFNGLMSSFPRINVYQDSNGVVVSADIAPTRYLIGQAMRDLIDENDYSQREINRLSPDMANVSLIAPVKLGGEYFLLSQIKGKALGSGQVHAGLVAGNIDAKYLAEEDPLTATLKNECSEELGIDLSYLNSTSIIFMIDERETGQVNFASVARTADMARILSAYEASTRNKMENQENLEVMALSMLPISGIALVPLEGGVNGLKDITCYKPGIKGLEKTVEDRQVRPYTHAAIDYVADKDNVRFLLEKAGF